MAASQPAEHHYWMTAFADAPERQTGVDHAEHDEYDVVVVGGGMAGLCTAVLAHDAGVSVVVLEASPTLGGTAYKSAAGLWVPNNRRMRDLGVADDREDALRFMAAVARPTEFDASAERHGLSAYDWERLEAFYDHAGDAFEALEAAGALKTTGFPSASGRYEGFLSYHYELDPSIRGTHRHLLPMKPDGTPGAGPELAEQLSNAAAQRGIEVCVNHRATGVIQDDDGAVIGVTADTPTGERTFGARRGVVFGSGGFAQNDALLAEHFRGPLYTSCAIPSAQGDFISIATELGSELGGMRNGWLYQDVLEWAAENREAVAGGLAMPPSDSMIHVDRAGRRVGNEKRIYQERSTIHWEQDADGEYPWRVLFMVYDAFLAQDETPWITADMFAAGKPWVIQGDTLPQLTAAIEERLATLSELTGGFTLDPAFVAGLEASIERFNRFARAGVDEDFGRGESPMEMDLTGPVHADPMPNRTMYPISDHGPYYCVMLCGLILDTNGGPRVNGDAQVLGADGEPIPGLYGVGNCVESVAGEGYFSGGSTLGPAGTFAYLAAGNVVREPDRRAARSGATA